MGLGLKVVLSIAGSDSSAGAGIQADMKSVAACGGYCATAITALTAQNTCGVHSVNVVNDEVVVAQVSAVMEDLNVEVIKLGMLPSSGIVECVRDTVLKYGIQKVVLDPVMVSTSGCLLVGEGVAKEIIDRLLPLSTIITPNIPESEFITGIKIESELDFPRIAAFFRDKGTRAVLLKSGHLKGDQIRDYLYDFQTDRCDVFAYKKIETCNTHGTGCSLSSAIAAFLARGYSVFDAVSMAEEYIHRAIESANYKLGNGFGPIHHFYKLDRYE